MAQDSASQQPQAANMSTVRTIRRCERRDTAVKVAVRVAALPEVDEGNRNVRKKGRRDRLALPRCQHSAVAIVGRIEKHSYRLGLPVDEPCFWNAVAGIEWNLRVSVVGQR